MNRLHRSVISTMLRIKLLIVLLAILLTSCPTANLESRRDDRVTMVVVLLANFENAHHESLTFSFRSNELRWMWLDLKEKIQITETLEGSLASELESMFKLEVFNTNSAIESEDFTLIRVDSNGEISKIGFSYKVLSDFLAQGELAPLLGILKLLEKSGRFSKGSLYHKLLLYQSNLATPGEFDKDEKSREQRKSVPSGSSTFGSETHE